MEPSRRDRETALVITARNYAAQAEFAVRKWSALALRAGYPDREYDSAACELLASSIKRAVHFAIPDNGQIFDDDLKGLAGLPVRLPFPSMTIEYFVEDTGPVEGEVHSAKRLVVATEMPRKDTEILHDKFLAKLGRTDQQNPLSLLSDEYVIHLAVVNEIRGVWQPQPMAAFIPCGWDRLPDNSVPIIEHDDRADGDQSHKPKMTMLPLPLLPGIMNIAAEKVGYIEATRHGLKDIMGETRALLELCEALACSNVTTEILHPENARINAKRVRKGKLPLYETRTLTIEVPHFNRRGQYEIGDRRGPRQHLRRGHIRRLDDTRRIWINSCVVGSAKNGRIDKSYQVTR